MTIELYHTAHSTCSQKVRVTLESKELEYLEAALRDLLARLPAEAVVRVQ